MSYPNYAVLHLIKLLELHQHNRMVWDWHVKHGGAPYNISHRGGLDIWGAMSPLGLSQLALQSESEASNTSEMCAVDRIYI